MIIQNKHKKSFFFIALIFEILALVIVNSTYNRSSMVDGFSKNEKNGALIIGIISSIFILSVILIIARFSLILVLKLVCREAYNTNLLNDIYYISAGIKLIFSMIAVVTLISGTTLGYITTNILSIFFYALYLFYKNKLKDSKGSIILQTILGILIILFI